jgi:hypothetical protein
LLQRLGARSGVLEAFSQDACGRAELDRFALRVRYETLDLLPVFMA